MIDLQWFVVILGSVQFFRQTPVSWYLGKLETEQVGCTAKLLLFTNGKSRKGFSYVKWLIEYSLVCNFYTDINELSLPKTCQIDFPDPNDLLTFKLSICPDEVNELLWLNYCMSMIIDYIPFTV